MLNSSFTGQANAIAASAHSRCGAARKSLGARSRAVSMNRPAMSLVNSGKQRRKRILKLGRLRLRGPFGAQDEFTLAAIAQNLRRLAMLVARPPPLVAACTA